MNVTHYIGLDVHKKSISYCVKTADGTISAEGKVRATRQCLCQWAQQRVEPWQGAMGVLGTGHEISELSDPLRFSDFRSLSPKLSVLQAKYNLRLT